MTDTEELEFYREAFKRLLRPMDFPFICGNSVEKLENGWPKSIQVCPKEGSEAVAIYTYKAPVAQLAEA